jgi:hypothetical protein
MQRKGHQKTEQRTCSDSWRCEHRFQKTLWAEKHWHSDPVRVRDNVDYNVISTETPERSYTITMTTS